LDQARRVPARQYSNSLACLLLKDQNGATATYWKGGDWKL
jgi:hypothetical protein